MPVATLPLTHASAAPGAAVSIAPTNQPPSNCKEIILWNAGTVSVLYKVAAVGTVLADDGNTGIIAAGMTKAFAVGPIIERAGGPLDPTEGGLGIVYQGIGAVGLVYLDYVNESAGLRR